MINQDEAGNEIILNTLGAGRSFGERGLVFKLPRSLEVRCKTDVGFIVINSTDFEKILQHQINEDLQLKQEFVKNYIPYANFLTGTLQDRIAYAMKRKKYYRG